LRLGGDGGGAPAAVELSDDEGGPRSAMLQQNIDLRRRLDEEHCGYRRKLQTYQDEQLRQAQLVQVLQAKVRNNRNIKQTDSLLCVRANSASYPLRDGK